MHKKIKCHWFLPYSVILYGVFENLFMFPFTYRFTPPTMSCLQKNVVQKKWPWILGTYCYNPSSFDQMAMEYLDWVMSSVAFLTVIKQYHCFPPNFYIAMQILILWLLYVLLKVRVLKWLLFVCDQQTKLGRKNWSPRVPFSSDCHRRAAAAACWIWWLCLLEFEWWLSDPPPRRCPQERMRRWVALLSSDPEN